MSREKLENTTPEELYETFKTDPKGTWDFVRVYGVRGGKRSGWLADVDPEVLPTARDYLAQTHGNGDFDLELAKRGSNAFGPQCRVPVAVDKRPPHAQQQGPAAASWGPPPPQWGQPPPWMMQAPPWFQQQAPPQQDNARMRDLELELATMKVRAEVTAQFAAQQRPTSNESPMEQMMRDFMRMKIMGEGDSFKQYIRDQQMALEKGIELGKLHAKGRSPDEDPAAWLPLVDRVASTFERLKGTPSTTTPAGAIGPSTAPAFDAGAFVSRCIRQNLPPRESLEMVRDLLGADTFKALLAGRVALFDALVKDERLAPLFAAPSGQQWLTEAASVVDELAAPAGAAPPAATGHVVPDAPPAAPEPPADAAPSGPRPLRMAL